MSHEGVDGIAFPFALFLFGEYWSEDAKAVGLVVKPSHSNRQNALRVALLWGLPRVRRGEGGRRL